MAEPEMKADDTLPWSPWRIPSPGGSHRGPDPAELVDRVRVGAEEYVPTLADVPAGRVTVCPVRTRLHRPRATDPAHTGWDWYPQLDHAYLLHLDDAFIGDNVVMDDDRYYGFGRPWLGVGSRLYADTREVHHTEAAVSIGGWGGEAFQLFIIAALPKLAMVLDLLDSPGFEPVKIVSHREDAPAAQWFWDALELDDRVMQKPKNAEAGFVVHADLVLYPQFDPTLRSYGIFGHNTLVPVRRRLGVQEPGPGDLVLYLDRPGPKIRSVANRDQLLDALSRRLAGTGLDLEVFHSRGPAADREAFERARIVLGPHGGAFANMIFARPGTHIVEFLPIYRLYAEGANPRPVYWGMAEGCGLDYWTTEPSGFEFMSRDMVVDVDDVLEIVDRILTGTSETAKRC